MSEELQELMQSNPEWYKNLQYDDVKKFIQDNINSAARSFIAIGYYLKYARDNAQYIEDGYNTIWEFAKGEFGIGKSSASQYMSINDKFSKDGNSPVLLEKYREFSSSKLSEMLTMTEEQLEEVTPTTTIVEIRQIKKPVEPEPEVIPETVLTSEQEESHDERWFTKWYFDKYPVDLAKLFEIRKITNAPGEIAKTFQKFRSPYGASYSGCSEWSYSFHGFAGGIDFEVGKEKMHMKYGRFVKEALDIYEDTEAENDNPEIVEVDTEIVDDAEETDISERSCSNCNYNEMDPDEYRRGHLVNVAEFPCNNCDGKLNHWEPKIDGLVLDCYNDEEGWHKEIISSEPDPVEIVTADIIPTEPALDETINVLSLAKELLKAKQDNLDTVIYSTRNLEKSIADLKYIEKCKIMVGALAGYIFEVEGMPEIIKPEQPELPSLKNNDQRKNFVDAYATWPLWIDMEPTGERYYRYDLSDTVAIVVKVSKRHAHQNYKETKDYEYGAEQYYLVGVNYEYGLKGSSFNEDTSRTFHECNTNKTSLIDYLKDFQKKK